MAKIYIEENGVYCIDCTEAMWSTDKIHEIYHLLGLNVLKDVDFVIETKENLLLVEYKNSTIESASASDIFDPLGENTFKSLLRKFYDSLHYLHLLGKTKTTQYICVLEWDKGNIVTRRRLRNRLKKQLPFRLQERCGTEQALINRVAVLNIDEWNSDALYRAFPIFSVSEMKSPQ